MSHTFKGNTVTFIYNSDFSGPIKITENDWYKKERYSIEVSFSDLKDFVLESMRTELMSKIEKLDNEELVKAYAELVGEKK